MKPDAIHPWVTRLLWSRIPCPSDLQNQLALKVQLFVFAGVAQRVGHHAATLQGVVAWAMQVAMQPELRVRQQVIERVAKACRAGHMAIAGGRRCASWGQSG